MFPLEDYYPFPGELLIWYEMQNGIAIFEDVESFHFGLLQPPIGSKHPVFAHAPTNTRGRLLCL